MKRLLYTVAYAEAADAAATRGFASAEVNLGDERAIESAARAAATRLLDDLYGAMEQGPASVAAFVRDQESRREKARASLQQKLDEALRAGRRWTTTFGWTIKGLATVKFASTVTIKVLSVFTGGAGTAVDIAYSGTKAGVEAWLTGKSSDKVQGIVAEETGKNVAQEAAETLNELVASGLMTQAEKNKWDGLLGNFKGDHRKLTEQIEKLSQQIEKSLKTGAGGKRVLKQTERHAKALAKLRSLPLQTAKALVKKNTAGLAKKAAGKTMSLVFLSGEVKDAWNQLRDEWQASN
jgi:hypothetical protein